MPLGNLISRPCTLTRRTSSADTDRYGDEIPGDQMVETVCSYQPRNESEGEDELGEETATAFFLVTEVVGNGDTLHIPGEGDFEINGRPEHWSEGSPAMHHIKATLKRTAGPEDGS